MATRPIFLDYASTTPMSAAVRGAMEPYFSDQFYNPSALYLAAKAVKAELEAARATCAGLLGVRPSELVFTAGTTEANNLAIRGIMEQFPDGHCIFSAIEHDSVYHCAESYDHSLLPVNGDGIVDVAALEGLIQDTTVLVSCMLANNEIGTVQPVAEVAAVLERVRTERRRVGNQTPLHLHTDAAQAFNYMQVLPHSLGADAVVIGGSKIYGPKQIALLYVRTGLRLLPQVVGGGQEWGLRAGTENVAAIIGLAASMQETSGLRTTEAKRLADIQQHAFEQLAALIPLSQVNGSKKHRLPNNIHLTIPGADNETLIMQLDEAGIQAAAGSACSASSDEPSHVLTALGHSDTEARSSLRFTMGRDTTQADIDKTIKTLAALLA